MAGDGFAVDAGVPVIANLTTNAARFSAVPPYNTVQVSFSSSEPLTDLRVSLQNYSDFACGDCQGPTSFQCEYAIEATDAVADVGGPWHHSDHRVGRGRHERWSANCPKAFTRDFTPPTVRESGSFFTPRLARAGERALS